MHTTPRPLIQSTLEYILIGVHALSNIDVRVTIGVNLICVWARVCVCVGGVSCYRPLLDGENDFCRCLADMFPTLKVHILLSRFNSLSLSPFLFRPPLLPVSAADKDAMEAASSSDGKASAMLPHLLCGGTDPAGLQEEQSAADTTASASGSGE